MPMNRGYSGCDLRARGLRCISVLRMGAADAIGCLLRSRGDPAEQDGGHEPSHFDVTQPSDRGMPAVTTTEIDAIARERGGFLAAGGSASLPRRIRASA